MARLPVRSVVAVGCLVLLCLVPVAASARDVSGDRSAAPVRVAVVDTGITATGRLGAAIDHGRSRSVVPGEDLRDHDGHGTAMASVVHGAAPDAQIIAVKAVGIGDRTSDTMIARAIDHAIRVGASIILVSLAGSEPLPLTRQAIIDAGHRDVLVVAAAGNDGVDLDRHPSYPGGYGLENLLTVEAQDDDGRLLPTSNTGGPVRAGALGASVPACDPAGEPTTTNGTSAAAALVAGAAATELRLARGRSATELILRLSNIETPEPTLGECD